MKGLLRRLAARAAGTAMPVRSDASLPFTSGGFGWAEASGPAPASAPAAAGLPSPPSIVDAAPAHEASIPDAVRRGSDMALPVPIVEAAVAAPARDPMPAVPLPSRRDASIDPYVAEEKAIAAPGLRAQPFAEPSTPEPSMPEPASPPSRPLPAFGTEADPRLTTRQPARSDPAPLMPPVADDHRAPLTPGASPTLARPSMRTAAAPDEATEVHIHIGRIDVTALHEAPAPRPRRAAAPAPMSLDGYLAQRSRA